MPFRLSSALLAVLLTSPGHALPPRVKNRTGKPIWLRPMAEHPGNSTAGRFEFKLYDSQDAGGQESQKQTGPDLRYFLDGVPGKPLAIELPLPKPGPEPVSSPSEAADQGDAWKEYVDWIRVSGVFIPPGFELEITELTGKAKFDYAFEFRESFKAPLLPKGCGIIGFHRKAPEGAEPGIKLSCAYIEASPEDRIRPRTDAQGSLILGLKMGAARPIGEGKAE